MDLAINCMKEIVRFFFSAAKILVGRTEDKSPLVVEQDRGGWRGN